MSISLNPYLIFDGNTREAVHFYEKALGGKVMGIMTIGNMPADPNYPLMDDMKDRVMHAHLKVGEADIMFSDTYEGMPYQLGNMIQMAIHPKEEARAREIFAALEDGGQVISRTGGAQKDGLLIFLSLSFARMVSYIIARCLLTVM